MCIANNTQQITKAFEENCRLLNDALEIILRNLHNEKEFNISSEYLELASLTYLFTELYFSINKLDSQER